LNRSSALRSGVFLSLSLLSALVAAGQPPKLILQITVDQLRGDLPTRYYDRLGEGGFKYLWEKGIVYKDAHHSHANTETIVGHATLATGAYPSVHGMVGNLWFDRARKRTVYNIEDANYHLLTPGGGVSASAEIDYTQAVAQSDGRSPNAILTTTFSDELRAYSNGRSKVFGVSVKDRGAVSLAGHAGKAFWFSKTTGDFVTSSYYYDQYPEWVEDWNAKNLAQQYAEQHWELLKPRDTYLFALSDDRAWETDLAGFGRIFPHPYGLAEGKYFNTLLTISPAGDDLTLDFAKTLLLEEKLGKGAVTDYLAVSFSSTDYVGHIFGPSSLEAEDNILRLDRSLAALFKLIDEEVGLKNTLIVLSSDHGGPDTPGYLQMHNIPAGYVDPSLWEQDAAIERVKKRFNIKKKLVEKFEHPYIYFTDSVINDRTINLRAVEQALAAEFQKFEGVAFAVSSRALAEDGVPVTPLMQRLRNNYHPDRSGQIYLVYEPNWYVNSFDGLTVASTHGSPWSYDTFVPIVFAGGNIKPQVVLRRVYTVDVATTLAEIAGVKSPSGAVGVILPEVAEASLESQ